MVLTVSSTEGATHSGNQAQLLAAIDLLHVEDSPTLSRRPQAYPAKLHMPSPRADNLLMGVEPPAILETEQSGFLLIEPIRSQLGRMLIGQGRPHTRFFLFSK
jgi:hypothetical protein